MSLCYIGIGSNLGDRRDNIRQAIAKINQLKGTKVTRVSSIIETLPVGGPRQGKYLNACLELKTRFSPTQLLKNLQNIELALGRVRSVKYAARTIDLDILLFNDKRIRRRNLIVPHPKMLERKFVLVPLKEIAPGIVKKLLANDDNQKN